MALSIPNSHLKNPSLICIFTCIKLKYNGNYKCKFANLCLTNIVLT